MITNERRGFTDDQWVRRVDDLRQQVDDSYYPPDASPQDWVAWYTAQDGEEYDADDYSVLLSFAERAYDTYRKCSSGGHHEN